jgi:flagellar hook-length control protein FliK
MDPLVTINAVKVEFTSIAVDLGAFQGTDEFERMLQRASEYKEDVVRKERETSARLASDRTKSDRLASDRAKRARQELQEGLENKRQQLRDELKSARIREQQIEDAQDKAEEQVKDVIEQSKFKADRPDKAASLNAVTVAGALLPTNFKNQLGASLISSGNSKNGLNSWLLTGGGRPTELLEKTLESLGGIGSMYNLEQTALGDLKNIFLESGLDQEQASELIAGLTGAELTLDKVLLAVRQADDIAASQSGQSVNFLTANSAGLNSFGQYLMSLGLSTETVKAVTSSLTPGESFSSSDLRALLSESGEIFNSATAQGNLSSLFAAFKAMGADQASLSQLYSFLGQSQGQASLDDLLGFMSFLEQPSPNVASPEKSAANIQKLLAQTSQNGELVKTPLFNEIVLKLAALGDKAIDSDFNELSPALQALRGGLSNLREQQSGNFSQGGRNSGSEREERLMNISGINSETVGRGLGDPIFQSTLEAAGGYASETLSKQIEQKLIYSLRRGIHRLKMDLEPESLGRLDVELKVVGDKLTAYIKADTLEAYEALEQQMSSLKQSLLSAGLELTMTLSYDGGQGRSYARSNSKSSSTGGQDGDQSEQQSSEQQSAQSSESGRLLDKVV